MKDIQKEYSVRLREAIENAMRCYSEAESSCQSWKKFMHDLLMPIIWLSIGSGMLFVRLNEDASSFFGKDVAQIIATIGLFVCFPSGLFVLIAIRDLFDARPNIARIFLWGGYVGALILTVFYSL